MLTAPFLLADAALVATQAVVVALPGRGVPAPIARLRTTRGALVAVACIVVFIAAGSLGPDAATALTRLAVVAVPVLAVVALAWAARGARPPFAVLAVPLLALAFAGVGSIGGDAAAAVLIALSCVTLGRVVAGALPARWIRVGLVAWAVYDAIAVFSNTAVSPDATVNAAIAGPGLPQFQVLDLHAALLGYPDVFVAAVLGGLLAMEGRRQWPVAALLLGLSIAFDALFAVVHTLPATVPVAAALLIADAVHRRRARAGGRISATPALAAAPSGAGAPAIARRLG